MYRTILVPLDGSERAERILPYVEELAQKFAAKLVLLQVIDLTVFMATPHEMGQYYDPNQFEQFRVEAQTYLETLQADLGQKGIAAAINVGNGPVVTAILAEAAEHNVDLIAMASHGRSGLARAFYGSVASGVLHQADRPLLLIRAQDD